MTNTVNNTPTAATQQSAAWTAFLVTFVVVALAAAALLPWGSV